MGEDMVTIDIPAAPTGASERAEWARRYWFREPISLPRGTRIQVRTRLDDALLPPAAARPPQTTRAPFSIALNVVRAK